MAEQKAMQKGFYDLISIAVKSVEESDAEIIRKGTGIRFSADYCNAVVKALQNEAEFKGISETQIKLALKVVFEAIVLNAVASELKVVKA